MTQEERVKAAMAAEKAAQEAEARGHWESAASYREEYKLLMTGVVQIAGPLPKFNPNE